MASRRQRSYQIDWAGPHGTAWGTVNGILTPITFTWLGHLAESYWPAPVSVLVLSTVAVTVLGVVFTLARAALRKARTPGATVVYKLLCWTGAGVWSALMVGTPRWDLRWWLIRVIVLAVAGVIAGVLAGLVKDDPAPAAGTDQQAKAQPEPVTLEAQSQVERDTLAAGWKKRLERLCAGDGYEVPNIEMWPRGNGYTVEAVAPAGGATWRSIAAQADAIAGDLDLPHGGRIVVSMGVSRRAALIEVTTVDVLAEESPYPDDRSVHSIRDDLHIGLRDDAVPIGPNLLQHCAVIAGETGSGKTNASHCLTAEIVTTDDALQWDWELTGGGLWFAWMDPWLRGEVDTPPVDWCAFDGRELLWMTRAALRVGYVRKSGYRQLMLDVNDDKVPVSRTLPEVILLGDEIAKVTGAMSDHPQACENLRLITFELRAAAVRTIFLALRGTDDVILNSIQSQCQIRAVLKVGNKAEASWVFGNHGFGPEDTPYPGCGGLSTSSGKDPIRMKWHRLKPDKIRGIAKLAARRRPELDELSRLAANGRNPDGSPMKDLLPDELDCYDARMDRFREWAEQGTAPAEMATASSAGQAQVGPPLPTGPVQTPAQAVADLNKAMADLDAAVARANTEQGQVPASVERDEKLPVDDGAWAAVLAAWDAEDYVPNQTLVAVVTGEPPTDWPLKMLDIVADYGAEGVGPGELRAVLADRGIVVHRDTLNEHLKAAIERGDVWKPKRGKYVRRWP